MSFCLCGKTNGDEPSPVPTYILWEKVENNKSGKLKK